MRIHICRPPFISCLPFPYKMVGNNWWFLVQRRIRNCGATEKIFVIAKYVHMYINRIYYHFQFVLKTTNLFTILFHVNKVTTKRRNTTTSLFLWHPIYRRAVHIYYIPYPRTSCEYVSRIVWINHFRNHKT